MMENTLAFVPCAASNHFYYGQIGTRLKECMSILSNYDDSEEVYDTSQVSIAIEQL